MAGQTTTGDAALAATIDRVRAFVNGPLERSRLYQQEDSARAVDELLAASAVLSKYADELASAAAYVARERGATWQHIGDQLGTSRQAAHERFAERIT